MIAFSACVRVPLHHCIMMEMPKICKKAPSSGGFFHFTPKQSQDFLILERVQYDKVRAFPGPGKSTFFYNWRRWKKNFAGMARFGTFWTSLIMNESSLLNTRLRESALRCVHTVVAS